jgi:hypothetical protein
VATDAQCRANQRLRLQTRDGDALIRDHVYDDDIYRRRDFRTWMGQIQVPTFASLQFDDEQTSSYAILSASDLLHSNPRVWLNLGSGHHRDSVSPDTITDYFEFLDIYVAGRAPEPKLIVDMLKDVIFGTGSKAPPLPPDMAPTLAQARQRFEARPRVRLALELPKGADEGANAGARWTQWSSDFPVPGSVDRTFWFGPGGTLADAAPDTASEVSYRPDPVSRRHDPSGSMIDPGPFTWTPLAADASVGFVTPPLTSDVVALGPAAASVALTSSAADTDLAVTITEVRPDGREMLVGTGVQRASMRHVDAARGTPTRPAFTDDRSTPLSGGGVVDVVPVQVMPLAHVFRAGSRIRVTVAAVNGDREVWAFDSVDPGDRSTVDTVHLGGLQPSAVTFTVAPLGPAPRAELPCPAAAKPCRPYVPAANGG